MAVGVIKVLRPPEQASGGGLGNFLGAVGGIAGTAMTGNPAVGMAAAQGGQMLGNAMAPRSQGSPGSQAPSVEVNSESALQRRQAAMDNSNLMQLRQSLDALKQLPPEQQAGLAQPLNDAYDMAKKKGYA